MRQIIMTDHKDLFKDAISFKKFNNVLKGCFEDGLTPIKIGDEILGSLLSHKETEEYAHRRMIQIVNLKPKKED